MQDRLGSRTVTILGTVMGTRRDGNRTLHRVEATAPGGDRILLEVASRKPHRGPVRVRWDPTGRVEPRFPAEIRWRPFLIVAAAIVLIVVARILIG